MDRNLINFFNLVNNLNRQSNLDNILERSFIEQGDCCKPCSGNFVDKLEKVIITNEDIDNDLHCAICQDSFKLDENIIKLPCKDPHYFHYKSSKEECGGILPWFKENNSCPICREEFPQENNDNIPIPDENFDGSINNIDEEQEEEEGVEQEETQLNDREEDNEDILIENIIDRIFNNHANNIFQNIENLTGGLEIPPNPMELNPIRLNIIQPMHFNTINLRPLEYSPDNYDPDLQEAIRQSLL